MTVNLYTVNVTTNVYRMCGFNLFKAILNFTQDWSGPICTSQHQGATVESCFVETHCVSANEREEVGHVMIASLSVIHKKTSA